MTRHLGAALGMAILFSLCGCGGSDELDAARTRTTQTTASTVRAAAMLHVSENPDGECPTVEALREAGVIDSAVNARDAWDRPFRIECTEDGVEVTSPGVDGQLGTDDDIRAQ